MVKHPEKKSCEVRRRAKTSQQDLAISCCPAYRVKAGYWQADQSLDDCVRMAEAEGTFKVRLPMTPEQYFNCADWDGSFDVDSRYIAFDGGENG